MNRFFVIAVGAIILIALVLFSVTYAVSFNEVAIVTTFGHYDEEESIVREKGMRLRWPAPIQSVRKLDTRTKLVETRMDTVATSDDLPVVVQAFLLWRVEREGDGPLEFARTYPNEAVADDQLEQRLRSALRVVLNRYAFDDLVGESSRLPEVERAILAELENPDEAGESLANLGIEPVVIGLSQVMLPPDTTETVIERMSAERQIRAQTLLSEGDAAYERIVSDAALQAEVIRNFARALADEIRAEGDAAASDALEIMQAEPDFATYLVWLEALEETASRNSTFFLPVDFAPFHLLTIEPTLSGVPQPASDPLAPPARLGQARPTSPTTPRDGGGDPDSGSAADDPNAPEDEGR